MIISCFAHDATDKIEEQIDLIRREKIKNLTLANINGVEINRCDPEEVKRNILPILKKYSIGVSCLFTKLGYINLDDESTFARDLNDLKVICKIANVLKCDHVTMRTPFVQDCDDEKTKIKLVEMIQEYVKVAIKFGVFLLVENHRNTFCYQSKDVAYLVSTINDVHFRALFNPANFYRCDEEPIAAYKKLRGLIQYFFFSDVGKFKYNVPVGLGEAHAYDILRIMAKDGYESYVTLKPDMKVYMNRRRIYNKLFIPFYGVYILFSRKYKSLRDVDEMIEKRMFSKVSPKYLVTIQIRFLNRMIEKATKED